MYKTSVVRIHVLFNPSDVSKQPFILFDLVNELLRQYFQCIEVLSTLDAITLMNDFVLF